MSIRLETNEPASAGTDEIKEKHTHLCFKSDIFNSHSLKRGSVRENLGGKPTFICDIRKKWNYDDITNVIEKAAPTNMGLLVQSGNSDNPTELLFLYNLFI